MMTYYPSYGIPSDKKDNEYTTKYTIQVCLIQQVYKEYCNQNFRYSRVDLLETN